MIDWLRGQAGVAIGPGCVLQNSRWVPQIGV